MRTTGQRAYSHPSLVELACRPARVWLAPAHPAVVLVCLLAVHAAGRAAAFCYPAKVDSFTYALAAYRLWEPAASPEALVPDKPPGQAILTGWVYRLATGAPSRVTMIPVESAFMLAGYGLFWLVSNRLHDRRVGLLLTGGLVLAVNSYNAFDTTTDGFNLAENYLLAPSMLAVWAHLHDSRRLALRGVTCGAGVGLALAVKQTAVALAVAIVLHGVVEAIVRAAPRDRARQLAGMAVGMAAVWAPIWLFLAAKGLWTAQLDTLIRSSGAHVAAGPFDLPSWSHCLPLSPLLLWMALGLVAPLALRRGAAGDARQRSALLFAAVWLLAEATMLWTMTKPAEHYWQQVVPPTALLASLGASAFARTGSSLRASERARIWRCVGAVTACAVLIVAVPLFAVAQKRASTFDLQWERTEFARRLAEASAADSMPQP